MKLDILCLFLPQASETSRGLFKCTTAEAVLRLVRKGAKVDERRADGATPLMVHAELGSAEVVNELIRQNANVDLQDEVCGSDVCLCRCGCGGLAVGVWVHLHVRCVCVGGWGDMCMFSGAQ